MSAENNKQLKVKLVDLKWIEKASPKKYNLRARKSRKTTSQKPDTKQKKIDSFFPVSPERKLNIKQRTPVKKPPESNAINESNEDLYLSPSAKFENLIPKVEDILRARAEQEKFKKIDAQIAESSKRFLDGLKRKLDEPPDSETEKGGPVKFNHCKHLTNAQLSKKFRKDVKYVDDIFYGRVPNERYELFKKDTPLNNGTKYDLRVNDTNIAFTQDQLIHIVQLFRERYDHGNLYKYSDFYFKVLLPEYCLKIYCDLYKMTPNDALDYLKAVPVHDVFF